MRFSSIRTPFILTSASNRFTFMTRGGVYKIILLRENKDGFYKAFCHVLVFVVLQPVVTYTSYIYLDRPDLVTSCLLLVSLMQLAAGSKRSSDAPWSPHSTTNATDFQSSTSCSADRSRALFVNLPILTSKIAACPFLPSFDSHKSRICSDE